VSEAGAEHVWTWVDAWVLAAIPSTRPGSDLSELIGAMDALNHAIPTRDELAGSLGRLIASGLVECEANRFRISEAGAAVRRRAGEPMADWSDAILPELAKSTCIGDDWPLTESQVSAAYAEYMAR